MKITRAQLKQIIKEEINRVLIEARQSVYLVRFIDDFDSEAPKPIFNQTIEMSADSVEDLAWQVRKKEDEFNKIDFVKKEVRGFIVNSNTGEDLDDVQIEMEDAIDRFDLSDPGRYMDSGWPSNLDFGFRPSPGNEPEPSTKLPEYL